MPQRLPIAKIHAAAWFFTKHSRDLNAIATEFSVSTDAVRKWAKTPEWDAALDAFKYTGDRSFAKKKTRDAERDAGDLLYQAQDTYTKLIQEGTPDHKLVSMTAEATGLTDRRIRDWAKRYGWADQH